MTEDGNSPTPRQSEFQKKSFTVRTLFTGTLRFVRNFPALIRAKRADRVSEQFAEKIMLAVTAVNECQYCTRFHTDLARDVGVDSEVISTSSNRTLALLLGQMNGLRWCLLNDMRRLTRTPVMKQWRNSSPNMGQKKRQIFSRSSAQSTSETSWGTHMTR